MTEEPDLKHREKKRGGCLLLGLFGTLVFYIFSPVLLNWILIYLPDSVEQQLFPIFEIVYFPLEWAYDHFEAVKAFYDWLNFQLAESILR